MTGRTQAVTVVGIGEDGCVGLNSRAAGAVARAQVLVGGRRHLDFFPQFSGRKLVLAPGTMGDVVDEVCELCNENNVVVLASGDPLFFGIGALLSRRLNVSHLDFIPQPSSVQLALASIGVASHDALMLSVHGRSLAGVAVQLRHVRKAAILTDGDLGHPARLAKHLLDYGMTGFRVHLCESLGGTQQRVREMDMQGLADLVDVHPLAVVVLLRDDAASSSPLLPYLEEDAYARRMPKNGLITKREVRSLVLANLQLGPRSVMWDVGTASGSVAIEGGLLASLGRVFAVDVDEECVGYARANARRFGADNVEVELGKAPAACELWPEPDAVFVGGSRGDLSRIMQLAWRRLRPGGRLVATAITLDNVAECDRVLRGLTATPEVTLVQVSRGVPLARYVRYEALNPIHVFAATKVAGAVHQGVES